MAVSTLPGNPNSVWTVKRNKKDEYDRYIVVSFINATLILSIGRFNNPTQQQPTTTNNNNNQQQQPTTTNNNNNHTQRTSLPLNANTSPYY